MMQQCPNGHIYDDAKYEKCPYCNKTDAGQTATDTFVSTDNITELPGQQFPGLITSPISGQIPLRGILPNDETVKKVLAWLVCISKDNPDYGKSFEVGGGDSVSVGSTNYSDIKLNLDGTFAHDIFTIAYDRRNAKLFIYQKAERADIYVNNSLLLVPLELHDYDEVEVCNVKYVFRTFCGENFQWNDD